MKLKEFQKIMKEKDIGISLLTNSFERKNSNFIYFSQVDVNAILIISENPILFTSPLEISIAKTQSKIKNMQLLKKDFFDKLKKLNPKIIGIDKDNLTLSQFKFLKSKLRRIKFVDISKDIAKLRVTKTEEEINILKKSCNFADKIMEKTIYFFEKAKTELDAKIFVDKLMLDLDLQPSFPTIIASNSNSKNPHHVSNNTKLKGFTIMDLGVKYKNYCSDMTRTVFIGKSSKKDFDFYNKILEVQQEVIEKNLNPKELHDLTQTKLGKYFIHSLGHGIGIDVHENPTLSTLSKESFNENMVFTLEPGYYNKFGIRIEDDFLFKNNKKIPITKSPKEFLKI